jgi:hypothetical protein
MAFEEHVGRRLEELFLFVLPRTAEDEKDNNGDLKTNIAVKSLKINLKAK